MKRDITLTESLLIALSILLILFITADRTYFRAIKEQLKALMETTGEKEEIRFTFVDIPEDREVPNPDAKLYSDIDRKAAGGKGKQSDNPFSQGNTFEVIKKQAKQKVQPQQPKIVPESKPSIKQKEQEEKADVGEENTSPQETGTPSDINSKEQKKILDPNTMFSTGDPEHFNNLNGGLVFPGTFSIDTKGFDLGPYAKELRRIVKSNWKTPEITRSLYLKGTVVVGFELYKDGHIENLKFLSETGIIPLDQSGLLAIKYSNPFPPLPSFVNQEKIEVKWTFYYNERPDYWGF